MILRTEAVCKQFLRETKGTNIFTAVKETDFELAEGKLTVLTGRSGSGKSTFLNMLSGLLAPTSGTVWAGEQNLYELEDQELSRLRNQLFGFIPQGQSAIHSLNVMENVLLPFTLYGDGEGAEEYARILLERMGIAELEKAMPSELSGGEMRRMAIARALVRKPAVVFADEPTGDLDDENTEIVFEMLRQEAEQGTSVLLVTHEKDADRYADEVYRMFGGVLEKQLSDRIE
ncbi:MAG: ABC transporter ATP-binding protein [Lachnospiraceae bacterium]|nr:ABC transporter ATP-binding protein [Lachnospiraceae bacterium]